jgi:histone H3/H4
MAEAFARECCKVVVAQVCQSLGFRGIKSTACETLANILYKYLEEVGYRANMFAELAGRIEVNFNDLRLTFEELGVSIEDLSQFATEMEEVPFPKAIPEFPMKKKKKVKQQPILKDAEEPLPPHIPSFLPPFPDKHTYIKTPIYEERLDDPKTVRQLTSKRKRQVQDAVTRFASHLHIPATTSYLYPPNLSYDSEDDEEDETTNPYLRAPKAVDDLPVVRETLTVGSGRLKQENHDTENDISSTSPEPTPLDVGSRQVIEAYTQMKAEELRKEEREKRATLRKKQRAQALIEESADKVKKRQKWEKILALKHDVPVDSLSEEPPPGTSSGRVPSPREVSTPSTSTSTVSTPSTSSSSIMGSGSTENFSFSPS